MRRSKAKVVYPPAKKALSVRPGSLDAEAGRLIQKAKQHPLGISFLQNGFLDSVAAIFQVHSFTVEKARDSLAIKAKPARSR